MKRVSALTVLALAAAALASGQTGGAKREVKRLNREWGEAVVRRDAEAHGHH